MRPLSRSIAFLAATTLGASASLAGDPTMYNIVTIPLPDDGLFQAMVDLNNSNQAAGNARLEVGVDPTFYSDGETVWLDELPGVTNAGLGINDAGHTTGWVYEWGVQWPEAFVWRGDNDFDLLGRPGGAYTYGQAINDLDQVVGFYLPDDGHTNGNAFVYSDGRLVDLGPGQAKDINNAGMIVGHNNRYFGSTTLWTPDGNGGWDRQVFEGQLAYGINESGMMIAGTGLIGALLSAAAVFDFVDGEWVRTDIGGWDPNTVHSIAHDVNDARQVVGEYTEGGPPVYGFLYEDDEVIWLNDRLTPEFADWHIGRAVSINEAGHILAEVVSDGGVEHNAILVPDELSLLSPRPGIAGETNTFISTGATEGERVHFVYAFATGSTPVPGCPDLQVDLRSPQIAGTARGDANGEARLTTFVPRVAAGRTIYLQTVEQGTCSVSNLVKYTFR